MKLQKFLSAISKQKIEQRIPFILSYYRNWGDLLRIRNQFMEKQYYQAYSNLLLLIRSHRKSLLLDVLEFENGFVQTLINASPQKNRASIRNYTQLMYLSEKYKKRRKMKEAEILLRLSRKVQCNGNVLLLTDIIPDKEIQFKEISHEFNAWIASGCTQKKQNFTCLVNDWRRFIPKNHHRKLDYYIWGLTD